MNTIKATVKIAGFLLVVLLALGCGGSMKPAAMRSASPASQAGSKFLYVGASTYRIDGLRGSLMPVAPTDFATNQRPVNPCRGAEAGAPVAR